VTLEEQGRALATMEALWRGYHETVLAQDRGRGVPGGAALKKSALKWAIRDLGKRYLGRSL